MSCCSQIKALGCFQSCDIIPIGEIATQSGNYTVEAQPDNKRLFFTYLTAGNPMFLTNAFNEDGTTIFRILLPDGTYFTAATGEDCFKITNSIASDPTKANTTVPAVACDPATYENSDTTFTQSIASGATFVSSDITVTQVDLSTTTEPTNKNITCNAALCPQTTSIIFNPLAIGDDTSALFTNPATTMTLTAISDDGASGTITVSVNGGAYAAFVNPTVVAITETLQVKRTITTGVGTVTITGTYA